MSIVTRHEMIALRALQLNETTERFCYRPVAKADAYPLFEVGQHQDFHRNLDWAQPNDVDGAMVQVQSLLAQELMNSSVSTSVVDKPTGSWEGLLRWVPFRDGLTIQLWIRPTLWLHGGPSELMDNALDLVYRVTSLDHIYAMVDLDDSQLVQLVEQKGMVRVGAFETTLVYRLQREAYQSSQG